MSFLLLLICHCRTHCNKSKQDYPVKQDNDKTICHSCYWLYVIPALDAGICLFLQHRLPAITCLLSGQCGSQGRSRCYGRRSSSCSPPRSGRCCGTSCRSSNSCTCCYRWCRNPSTIPLRYRSCRKVRNRSAFSALLDVSYFRCCRNTSPLHPNYRFRCT